MKRWVIGGDLIRRCGAFEGNGNVVLYDKNSMKEYQFTNAEQAERDGNYIDAVIAERQNCPQYFRNVIIKAD